jgi:hypothetical protein
MPTISNATHVLYYHSSTVHVFEYDTLMACIDSLIVSAAAMNQCMPSKCRIRIHDRRPRDRERVTRAGMRPGANQGMEAGHRRDRAMAVERALVMCACAATVAAQQQPAEPQLSRVSCDASYNAPCARSNSEYLAREVARAFDVQISEGVTSDDILAQITAGDYNIETEFYPFLIDAATSTVLAHGQRSDLVGQSLPSVFVTLNLQYSDPELLQARFVAAASAPGGQRVQYLWSAKRLPDGEEQATSKEAFVVGVTREDGSTLLCLGVGFADNPLPPELPCSAKYDSFCAINNVRSLVGKAQTLLAKAETQANFEDALLQLSYAEDQFELPGGFYLFMYNFQGPLVAHGKRRDYFGQTLGQILVANRLGTADEGTQLHHAFVAAAENASAGEGWTRYEWRDGLDEPTYTKIALVAKIQFNAQSYYIGAGFKFAMESVIPDESAEIRSQSADAVAKLGALGEDCSVRYNLPCSVVNTLQLASHALVRSTVAP